MCGAPRPRGDEEAASPSSTPPPRRLSRAHSLEPPTEHGGGEPEEDDGEGEDPGQRRSASSRPAPTAVMPRTLRQRQIEDAEGVGLTDAQVNGECGRRHEPSVEPRPGDDSFLREYSRHHDSPRIKLRRPRTCRQLKLPIRRSGSQTVNHDPTTSQTRYEGRTRPSRPRSMVAVAHAQGTQARPTRSRGSPRTARPRPYLCSWRRHGHRVRRRLSSTDNRGPRPAGHRPARLDRPVGLALGGLECSPQPCCHGRAREAPHRRRPARRSTTP